jgi:hypothetical protein
MWKHEKVELYKWKLGLQLCYLKIKGLDQGFGGINEASRQAGNTFQPQTYWTYQKIGKEL